LGIGSGFSNNPENNFFSTKIFHPAGAVKTMSSKTAFIGLGVMGYPMAGHLNKEGMR